LDNWQIKPKYGSLVAIANAANINMDWLMTGEGEMRPQNANNEDVVERKAHTQKLLDLPPTAWVEIDSDDFEVWECEEPNMEPTLHVGDMYLIDMTASPSTGVYLVDIGGCKKAMRLAVVPDGIKCSNDNPLYKGADFTIVNGSNEVRIVGRVLRTGKDKRPV
jgi:phage repressor protein C with HTH and peptisase S24 domain